MAAAQRQAKVALVEQVADREEPQQQGGQKRPEVASSSPAPPEAAPCTAPSRLCSIKIDPCDPSPQQESRKHQQQQEQVGSMSPVLLKVQQTIPRTFSASALNRPDRRPSGSGGREQRFSFWDSLMSSASLDRRSKSQCLHQMDSVARQFPQAEQQSQQQAHLHLQPQRLDIKR